MHNLSRKLKKGFSLAEVVIAIAVISIISVSAISVVTLSVKNKQKNLRANDIAITCDSVIDCFRFDNLDTLSYVYKNYDAKTNTIDRGSYILEIKVNQNKITLTAKDNETTLHEVSYEKYN